MKRKALLSVLLSVVMILGSASPAFAAGQMPSSEVSVGMESSISDSRDDAETEHADQNESAVNSEKESANTQETAEEGVVGTEAEPEEAGIEEVPDKDSNVVAVEGASSDESKTESVVEEEEQPETLVGAEGERVSVGENVTAVFNSETGTVTFYSRGGTLSRGWASMLGITKGNVKEITISEDSDIMYLPQNSSNLFSSFNNIQSLNLFKVDTSNVTNMNMMFSGCENLQYLDVSGFDTSNVTNMGGMFSWCRSLQTLDVSGFDTSNVTSMGSMFSSCWNLHILDLSGFDTSNVTIMSSMFNGSSNLQTLDLSVLDTSNVTDMSGMFGGWSKHQTLDLSGFDTSNVRSMMGMFRNCSGLEKLDLSGFDTSNVIHMSSMFEGCSSLQELNISGFDTSNVRGMIEMFENCSCLQTLDLSGFDTSNVENMIGMFINCSSLQTLDLSGFDTSGIISTFQMFKNCSNLQTLDISGFNTSNVTEMREMFFGCSNLQTLDLSGLDMSNAENISSIFEGCNFDILLTPVNLNLTVALPGTFIDASGTEYDTLPQDLSESIRLTKIKNIADATVTGIADKTYTGLAQTQSPIVKFGGKTLSNGTDYTLSYANNTNAGTATVVVRGIGNFKGSVGITFKINQAAPKLTFASKSITKTTQDAAFTNTLTKKTDGTVTFKSSNTSVATVNSTSGKVTIKGAGTTTITATATAGTNYKAGSAQYTLTVTESLKIVSISDDFYGKTGTQASFHIEAEGSGTITYQWQYRTAGMTSWKAPAKASARTADYTFGLKPSYDNIEVRCIISDGSGRQVISETRKANVFAILSQPDDVTVPEGQRVVFEVSAIGRGVTYQWYYMRPNGVWNVTTISGSRTAVLPITAGTKNDGTSYRCVITDEEGNQITSAAGVLTMDNSLRITGISEDAYGKSGESVTFHIDAVGNGALSYQWQYKLAGETKWRTPGKAQVSAKTADYAFKLTPSYDNIEVRCIVKDEAGNTCTSDVRKANVFAITKQPELVIAELGERVTFSVEGIGKNLTYQWYYRRLEGGWNKVTTAGHNTASLTVTAQVRNNASQYRCYVYDGLGNLIKSQAAMLIEENEDYEG